MELSVGGRLRYLQGMRAEARPWWRQAQADLQNAELVLQAGQFYLTSILAHQAAEKALKALYVEQHAGGMPARTHDVGFLATQVGTPTNLEDDLETLAPAFSIARYPDDTDIAPVDAIDHATAIKHLDAARRILEWIGSQF